jgi:hypothetical protein
MEDTDCKSLLPLHRAAPPRSFGCGDECERFCTIVEFVEVRAAQSTEAIPDASKFPSDSWTFFGHAGISDSLV